MDNYSVSLTIYSVLCSSCVLLSSEKACSKSALYNKPTSTITIHCCKYSLLLSVVQETSRLSQGWKKRMLQVRFELPCSRLAIENPAFSRVTFHGKPQILPKKHKTWPFFYLRKYGLFSKKTKTKQKSKAISNNLAKTRLKNVERCRSYCEKAIAHLFVNGL